ncbi:MULTISPECIES: HAMP domain-containing sensor histidine kinase [Neobacillus]|uniref:Heme sensor protein HssS n=1 Tax=Neobacillus rhizophilus TaxID=2833579 RepID=A0A942U2U0_9BACI|nr:MULTISPECIES: HAMP domain-containing sensor histidine kinase [Neobacillus]MBS4213580.1 HAMP domain-containing histidine kinase [Neobacillus rhizophilus]MBU8918012.1 HAMP domain-containing histidine kinase [Bacillus sp. FJAT-29953]
MKTLYVKFIVITIGMMLISFILAFVISNIYYQQKLKPYNDDKNTKVALDIAAFAEAHPEISLTEYLKSITKVGYQIYLVDKDGNRTFFGDPFRDKSLPVSTQQDVLKGDIFHGMLHFPQETFVTGFFADELKNTIGVPLQHKGRSYALFIRPDIKFLFNEMHILFGWILVLAITLTIVMVLINTKYLVKPISNLTKATKSLANGDFNVELDSTRHDELGELSDSFSRMARKLAQMEDMRKEFISNISHDIQSPLSNIKGYTNLLENQSLSKEEREQYLSIINGEISRLSTLTKQLLLLASLDRNEDILRKNPFNVGAQIKELVRNHQWAINEKEIMLSYSLPDIEIVGDPSMLNTVWDNLLSNAMKYNRPNGTIDISIEKRGQSVYVTFDDTGIGMNNLELDRIFDRFYRADKARTRTIEGTGLGLSIVKTIIDLHSGHIQVSSKENEGTTFIVELPV